MLPVGLSLLCDQVQRATPVSCEQQMASHRSGPAVDTTSYAAPCANSAFCAITAPAVVEIGRASCRERVEISVGAVWVKKKVSGEVKENRDAKTRTSTLM